MAVDCFSSYVNHFRIAHDVSLDNISSCLSDDNNDPETADLASTSPTTATTTETPGVNYLEHSFSVNLKNATNLLKGTGMGKLEEITSPLKVPPIGSLRIEDVEKLEKGINQVESEEEKTQLSNIGDVLSRRESYEKRLDEVSDHHETPGTTTDQEAQRYSSSDGPGQTTTAPIHQVAQKRGDEDKGFEYEGSRRKSTSSEEGSGSASNPSWTSGAQRPTNIKRRRRPRKLPEIPTHSQRKNLNAVPLSSLVNFQSLADEIRLVEPSSNFNINQSASTTAWRYGISTKDPNGIDWRELGSPENIEPPRQLETDCEHFMHAILSPSQREEPVGCSRSPDYCYEIPKCTVKTPDSTPTHAQLVNGERRQQDEVQQAVSCQEQVQSPPESLDAVANSPDQKLPSPPGQNEVLSRNNIVRSEVPVNSCQVQTLPSFEQTKEQTPDLQSQIPTKFNPELYSLSCGGAIAKSKPQSLGCNGLTKSTFNTRPSDSSTQTTKVKPPCGSDPRSSNGGHSHGRRSYERRGEFCESAEYFDDEPRRHKSALMSQLDDNIDLNLNTTASSHKACLGSNNQYLRADSSPEDLAPGRRPSDQGSGMGACGNSGQRGRHPSSSSSSTPSEDLGDLEPTHRGCHKFIPRHEDEMFIEIGDPIYVEDEADDLWCEGINLKTCKRGIFPAAYATDLSLLEGGPTRYMLKFLGSVEVSYHKGNDVLCQAMHKVEMTRRTTMNTHPPPRYCLEVTEYGIRMTDRSRKRKDKNRQEPAKNSTAAAIRERLAKILSKTKEAAPTDHFFSLKNVSFCGCHPKNDKYFAFITKHPLEMRFACHVFLGDKSTRVIAEVVGESFRKFYQEYMAFVHPTEDIYLE